MAGTAKARKRPSGRFSAPRLAAATEQILKGSSRERSPDMRASGQRSKEGGHRIAALNDLSNDRVSADGHERFACLK